MKGKGLVISVALLAILGGIVYWSEKQKEAEEKKGPKDAPPKVLTIPTDQFREVRIQRIGKPLTVIKKTGDKWIMTEPVSFPLDEDSVNSLVTTLSSIESDRRSQVGTGERSEKIRTYNYPQNRVTDHRIGLSNYNLPGVMDGNIDEFIDELSTRDEAERLASSGFDEE